MAKNKNVYIRERTALLFVDPYNDVLSEGGKLWPLVEGVAREVGLLDNLRTITGRSPHGRHPHIHFTTSSLGTRRL